MFPPTSTPAKRSLAELMRGALDSALEFATLGEASLPGPAERPLPQVDVAPPAMTAAPAGAPLGRPEPPVPPREHPHRRPLSRRPARARRTGAIPARVQPCLSPVHTPPASQHGM
jgi:hypothetical protein